MGRVTLRAVLEDPELELAAAYSPGAAGVRLSEIADFPVPPDLRVAESLRQLIDARPDVVLDFTTPQAVEENAPAVAEAAIHLVIGTSGLTPALKATLRRIAEARGRAVLAVPNFCLGVVLMMKFAQLAAPFYSYCEVVERHHEKKLDAPSGTAVATAERIAKANPSLSRPLPERETVAGSRGAALGGVGIHALRLPGVMAEQEVVFGAPGETLSLVQRTTDRQAFVPGIVMALKRVGDLAPGYHEGLEAVMEELR